MTRLASKKKQRKPRLTARKKAASAGKTGLSAPRQSDRSPKRPLSLGIKKPNVIGKNSKSTDLDTAQDMTAPISLMRGVLRGKRLVPHASWVRPTSLYRREVMFNRLVHVEGFQDFSDKRVLDVFAGTGALGLEALSRGAQHVTFFEKNHTTCRQLKEFLEDPAVKKSFRSEEKPKKSRRRPDAPELANTNQKSGVTNVPPETSDSEDALNPGFSLDRAAYPFRSPPAPLMSRYALHCITVPGIPKALSPVDLCFLDAPYNQDLIPLALKALHTQGWLKNQTLLITETDADEPLPLPPWIFETDQRQKGRTVMRFLRVLHTHQSF